MDGEPPAKRNRQDEPSTSTAQQSEDEMDQGESSSKVEDQFKLGESEQKSKNVTIKDDCFKVKSSSTLYMKRFKTEVIEHIIHFSGESINQCMEEQQDISPYELFRELFQRIIDTLVRTFPEQDRILIEIHLPGSDRPIYVPIMEVHQINADAILNAFQQVQQSNRKIKLDGRMEFHVIHIEVPNGRGDTIGNDIENEFLKSKKSIIRIQNRDTMCLARALVTARARLEYENGDKSVNWENIRKGLSEQTRQAKELQTEAGACTTSSNILDDVPKYQNIMTDYQILIVPMTGYRRNGFLFKGPEKSSKKLYILFTSNHFHVITSMKGFLECGYFCERCWKGFKTIEHHRCTNMCECCFNNVRDGCSLEKWKECEDCLRWFKSISCYDRHKKAPEPMTNSKKASKAKAVCDRIKWCAKCQSTIKDQHKCGYAYCGSCKTRQPIDHLCYMQPLRKESQERDEDKDEGDDGTEFEIKPTKRRKEQVYIFFDFECRQDEKGENGEFLHVVNYCVAQRVCGICMHKENVESSCENCKSHEKYFKGDNALDEFCKWLLSRENWNAIAVAHNMKGYDGHFILKYLHRVGICPKVIMNGSKLMVIQLKTVKLIDSLNFIPSPLSAFSKTFGIEKMKGYFPHLFNTQANEAYKGSWPDRKFYSPDEMKEEERNDFNKWYDQQIGKTFDMALEIHKYCKNDVNLLRRGCSHFRSYFYQTTGEEPFQSSLTIASACLRVFRRMFLQKETIAIVPPNGYRSDKQSLEALRWLRWKEKSDKICIQHSRNGGEQKFGKYKVDGFCMSNKTIYEFNGCYWHGCPKCYKDQREKGRGNEAMEEKHQRYLHRKKDLKKNHCLEEIWECEFKEQLKTNSKMKAFVESLDFKDPLEPRDAFYGGRTNVIKLHHTIEKGERIKYIDVCSLYPWVNKYGKYPVGHPEIITRESDLTTDIEQYEGLIKCTILPPEDLFHPVLPHRCDGKLFFPLCNTCAKHRKMGPCSHSDDERALHGTWVTEEVKKALEKGYVIKKVYEVWHFKETSEYDPKSKQGGLFTQYVNTFLTLKQEADGWPSDCQSDLERSEFIRKYNEKEGTDLKAENIERNEGKRALAKLMLNSFWGKFGQRPNLPQTEYVQKLERYYKILLDDTKVIKSLSFVSDSMVQIQWQDIDENLKTMPDTNVFIAAYTTALARLKLYSFLEQLDRRVLYFDTDSIIYLSKGVQQEYEPPTGKFLGDMTDELSKAYGEGSYITEFLSGGPKNYSYTVFNPSTGEEFFECKVKGITMNFEAKKQINFDVMKTHLEREISEDDLSDEYSAGQLSEAQTPIRNQPKIRSKGGIVVTKPHTKTYRIVSDKRRVKKDLTTLPFGFKPE
ncbi:putative DNA polymerase [Holothuria leucospilota]|uniref:DNA-directed DNA polymerase n=1 Tax=Holothuria leucospilota TaxID=206669 RepID=A0A9Q0YHV7_HOLLE|nr:putative DNA polymerase [Holothuria leucospilota]